MNVYSAIHNHQKLEQPKCYPTCEYLNKLYYILAMEDYTKMKRKTLLIHTTQGGEPQMLGDK